MAIKKIFQTAVLRTFLFAILLTLSAQSTSAQEDRGEYDFSWLDPDKKIYVVQNRKYQKEGKLDLGISFGTNLNSAFNDVLAVVPHATYFFTEDWGVELLYLFGSNSRTNIFDEAKTVGSTEPFVRELNSTLGFMVNWAPFYGKFNTFNRIIYFDWIFGVGLGRFTTTVDPGDYVDATGVKINPGLDGTEQEETYTGLLGNVGLKFFLTRSISLRLDFLFTGFNGNAAVQGNERFFTNHFATAGLQILL